MVLWFAEITLVDTISLLSLFLKTVLILLYFISLCFFVSNCTYLFCALCIFVYLCLLVLFVLIYLFKLFHRSYFCCSICFLFCFFLYFVLKKLKLNKKLFTYLVLFHLFDVTGHHISFRTS